MTFHPKLLFPNLTIVGYHYQFLNAPGISFWLIDLHNIYFLTATRKSPYHNNSSIDNICIWKAFYAWNPTPTGQQLINPTKILRVTKVVAKSFKLTLKLKCRKHGFFVSLVKNRYLSSLVWLDASISALKPKLWWFQKNYNLQAQYFCIFNIIRIW